jgi:transcriptional regulator with XRE-family HTH domain
MFAKRLKELRVERGIGQIDLAKSIGVSFGTISLWENGKREPTLGALIALSKFFHTSIDELVGNV